MTTKFEVGNVYEMRFIGDSNLSVRYICVKRTEKTATFEEFKHSKPTAITRKIKFNHEGNELIYDGNYSFAPCINSKRVVC